MEPHKVRFVRCPKCYQLLVEYPSIPVYKCGGCNTVLRSKIRAVPAVQTDSEYDEQSKFPCSLKGPPRDNKPMYADEQKIASSVDQPREAAADVIICSPMDHTNSCKDTIKERAVSAVDHQKEEKCSSIDGNTPNPGVTVKEMHENGMGADFGSNTSEVLENLDTSQTANRGKVESVQMAEMSTMCEKTEAAQKEERLHAYKDVHVESHEALIEELERSLSLSSDDEYFSDEAETSELSDALRHQMGSRRFMSGGRTDAASRSDPHGRLIEELEMSFSDTEEPMEQQPAFIDRIHEIKHDKHPQTLNVESANPCEESISSLDSGHFELEQTLHQVNRPVENGNQEKENIEDDNKAANDVHVIEHDKRPQTLGGPESAHPCEESIPSLDNGYLESEQTYHEENRFIDNGNEGKEDIADDNDIANDVHGNEHIVAPNEVGEEIFHEKEHDKDWQPADSGIMHPCDVCFIDDSDTKNIPSLDDGYLESEHIFHQENRLIDNGNEGKEDIEDANDIANGVHGNEHIVAPNEDGEERFHEKEHDKDWQHADSEITHPYDVSSIDSDIELKQTVQPNVLTEDATQEKEEDCIDDVTVTNYIDGNENLVLTDEDIAVKVHSNEEVAFDHTRESEEGHLKDDNLPNYVRGKEHVSVLDEHIAERIDKNEHSKYQDSMEAEIFNTGHVKYEVSFQQKELKPYGSILKEENVLGDGNRTNSIQEDSAEVASVSTLSNKRTQCKLHSFNQNKEEGPYKYRASQLQQGLSFDAEDYRSIQHVIELQMDDISGSLSSGSPSQGNSMHRMSNKFNNIVRHDRLKKMDELRDQLSRLSSQKSVDKKYQKTGLEYKQQFNSYDVEQHFQRVDVDSAPNSCALESYYGHERPPRYQPPNPFSPTQTYPRCHFGHAQKSIPYICDMWEFNSYYQSSYAESTVLDHESLIASYKEPKRMVRKHILRPLSGASPFSICSSCFNLVQMPSDMYISKAKIGKMQCGKCSKVLVLSFPAACHGEGKISEDVTQPSNQPAGSMVAKNKDATSHSAECLRGSISINEECGASFTRSFSTQARTSLAATQSSKKISDSALHRLMGYDSASQLLRHSRALEDGYDSFESMVPVSSRISRRKNM